MGGRKLSLRSDMFTYPMSEQKYHEFKTSEKKLSIVTAEQSIKEAMCYHGNYYSRLLRDLHNSNIDIRISAIPH